MDFLSEIIAVKRQRLAAAKARVSLDAVRELARHRPGGNGSHLLSEALQSYTGMNVIAEFKRRSPSKGKINAGAAPAAMAAIYESAGAAAISVLTEEDYFDGSLEDLRQVREITQIPILRKDFIFDEYQVYESAAAGADALLLIVAALDDETLKRLREITEDELGMDALVEVHNQAELDRALKCGARLVGVNNRDLHSFTTSTDTSYMLARAANHRAILVSESGLTPEEARKLRLVGYQGFLVGETLMRASNPGAKLREFIQPPEALHRSPKVWVKICGITNLEDGRAAIEAGADLLGFNFYRPSPRYIEPTSAKSIVQALRSHSVATSRPVSMVGVFVNESSSEVSRIADEVDLDGLQFHGDETLEYVRSLRRVAPVRFLIKAVGTDSQIQPSTWRKCAADALMIDSLDPRLRGGTGNVADWTAARRIVEQFPRVFLAGGLSPENVTAAIAAVHPYAVDACSSLEISPGRKSATRMKDFVAAVRTTSAAVGAADD
jgi:indole-3-glycerol phosphate synthase/phosphoribosylanthranilate isomerase